MKPRIKVYDLDDGWHGIYVDGKLFSGSDGSQTENLYRALIHSGLIKSGDVSFVTDEDFDHKVTESGIFPEIDPNY
jgi:hypothetical protein